MDGLTIRDDAAAYAAAINPVRGIITYQGFVLYPDDVNAAITAKPTRFLSVKGIPKMMSEERLKKLFSEFGPIFEFKKTGEGEYVIEYFDVYYAQKATTLSDYIIKVGNKNEAPYVGNMKMTYLTVQEEDFSDDEVDLSKPPNRKEFKDLAQKLSNPDTLPDGIETLKDWLKNKRCNVGNSCEFYSLLEAAFKTSNKLGRDKNRYEEQIKMVEKDYRKAISGMTIDLTTIGKIFNHEDFDKIASAFPEEERNNLLEWKKEFLAVTQELGDMTLSNKKKNKKKKRSKRKQKKQNSLSQGDVSPGDLSPEEEFCPHAFNRISTEITRGRNLSILAQKEDLELQLKAAEAARGHCRREYMAEYGYLNQSLIAAHMKVREYEAQLADWNLIHERLKNPEHESDDEVADCSEESNLSSIDARLITALTTFLGDRQHGATLGDIRNYLRRREFRASGRYIADLMRRFPALFKEVKDEKAGRVKWLFAGAEVQDA